MPSTTLQRRRLACVPCALPPSRACAQEYLQLRTQLCDVLKQVRPRRDVQHQTHWQHVLVAARMGDRDRRLGVAGVEISGCRGRPSSSRTRWNGCHKPLLLLATATMQGLFQLAQAKYAMGPLGRQQYDGEMVATTTVREAGGLVGGGDQGALLT